jgi:hypothetical protein
MGGSGILMKKDGNGRIFVAIVISVVSYVFS